MISRVAIFAASLVAALTLAVGLAIAGLTPGTGAADVQPASDQVVAATEVPATAPAPTIQVDTIYVAPDPVPEEVVVTKVEKAAHHDDEDDEDGEHESEDDEEGEDG
jgi:hypothetical protein